MRRAARRIVVGLLIAAVVAAAVVTGVVAWYAATNQPLPLADRCEARVQSGTTVLRPDQAHYASIVVGVGTQRGLVPRASSIALATVYQESGIRNLDYGDRDSLGLFQQRPSQGWGTPEQVMDPWYASNAFYATLVKVPNWDTGDINDVAQAVQRSGHPKGYVRHVENARRVASSLTGETPASFTCRVGAPADADPAGFAAFLGKTLPSTSALSQPPGKVVITAKTTAEAWSAAHIAVANAGRYGVTRVDLAGRRWTPSRLVLADWSEAAAQSDGKVVEVSF